MSENLAIESDALIVSNPTSVDQTDTNSNEPPTDHGTEPSVNPLVRNFTYEDILLRRQERKIQRKEQRKIERQKEKFQRVERKLIEQQKVKEARKERQKNRKKFGTVVDQKDTTLSEHPTPTSNVLMVDPSTDSKTVPNMGEVHPIKTLSKKQILKNAKREERKRMRQKMKKQELKKKINEAVAKMSGNSATENRTSGVSNPSAGDKKDSNEPFILSLIDSGEVPNVEMLSKSKQKELLMIAKKAQQKLFKKEKAKEKAKERRSIEHEPIIKKVKMDDSTNSVSVVIDFDYDEVMADKNMAKYMDQVMHIYRKNRNSSMPLQLHVTSIKENSPIEKAFKRRGYQSWDLKKHQEPYHELFEHDRIVYLTSESDNILNELDPNAVYIIGGLMDQANQSRGISLRRAQERGLKTARLPLSEHTALKSRFVLTISQVFEILLKISEGNPWKDTLVEVVPICKKLAPIIKIDDSPNLMNVAIDFDYDELTMETNFAICSKQIGRVYTENRRSSMPIRLHFTSMIKDCRFEKAFNKLNEYKSWDVKKHQEPYHEIFEHDRIVYLTSDSDNVLNELDPNAVYIIGGLIDQGNFSKGVSLRRAQEKGFKTARLPLSEHTELDSRSILTIAQVFRILLKVSEGKPWKETLDEILPIQKIQKNNKRHLPSSKKFNGNKKMNENKNENENTIPNTHENASQPTEPIDKSNENSA